MGSPILESTREDAEAIEANMKAVKHKKMLRYNACIFDGFRMECFGPFTNFGDFMQLSAICSMNRRARTHSCCKG